jgi:hypothetical protein
MSPATMHINRFWLVRIARLYLNLNEHWGGISCELIQVLLLWLNSLNEWHGPLTGAMLTASYVAADVPNTEQITTKISKTNLQCITLYIWYTAENGPRLVFNALELLIHGYNKHWVLIDMSTNNLLESWYSVTNTLARNCCVKVG